MNRTQRIQLLQEYRNGPAALEHALAGLPKVMRKYKPAPNKWSVHEIVIHLADSEVQSHVRCRMILSEPGTTIVNADEHQWSVALNYLDQDFEEAISIISAIRATNFSLLRSVSDGLWKNAGVHTVRGTMTLEDWLQTYTAHIPGHIRQMNRNYREWLERAT